MGKRKLLPGTFAEFICSTLTPFSLFQVTLNGILTLIYPIARLTATYKRVKRPVRH